MKESGRTSNQEVGEVLGPGLAEGEDLVTAIFPQRRSVFPNVTQVQGRILQEHVGIEVYWLDAYPGIAGPGASLYVHQDEVLRLDCMGSIDGHMHINMHQSETYPGGEVARLYFSENTYEAQLERAAFELKKNSLFALTLNDDKKIQETRIAQEILDETAEWMVEAMRDILRRKIGETEK